MSHSIPNVENNNLDYSDYEEAPPEDILGKLSLLAEDYKKVEDHIADLEAQLKAANDRAKDIAQSQIPLLMDSIRLEEFKTRSGFTIKVKENIRASIPKQFEEEAFSWLRETGNGALIKREVKLSFGKGDDEKAEQIIKSLIEKNWPVEDKSAVHPGTLSAFVKEKLEAGANIPLNLLGVYRQRVAKIAK